MFGAVCMFRLLQLINPWLIVSTVGNLCIIFFYSQVNDVIREVLRYVSALAVGLLYNKYVDN